MNQELVTLIKDANHILIFTGAGISTASGIRDFRGPNGVWKTRQPVYYEDFMTSEEARIEAWDQKLESWEAFKNARPNDTHRAIVDLEIAEKVECVVTQNIDGLHARAGTSSNRLVEVHGTNSEIECQTCGDRSLPDPHYISFMATGKPPTCSCGGYLKTATISFGQNLREEDLHRATIAASNADLVIALGSTLSVYPAATFPLLAAEQGAPYVIINQGETDHDDYAAITLRIEGNVTEIFPQAVALALEKSPNA